MTAQQRYRGRKRAERATILGYMLRFGASALVRKKAARSLERRRRALKMWRTRKHAIVARADLDRAVQNCGAVWPVDDIRLALAQRERF